MILNESNDSSSKGCKKLIFSAGLGLLNGLLSERLSLCERLGNISHDLKKSLIALGYTRKFRKLRSLQKIQNGLKKRYLAVSKKCLVVCQKIVNGA